MKKFFLTLLITLSLLGISSCCFASNMSVNDLEKFLSVYGYDIDFEEYTFNGTSFSNFSTYLEYYYLKIFDLKDKGGVFDSKYIQQYSEADLVFLINDDYSGPISINLTSNSANGRFYYFYSNCRYFFLDIDNKTIIFRDTDFRLIYDIFYEKNSKVSKEEFESVAYQKYLLERSGFLYSETSIKNSSNSLIFYPRGGKIVQSSFGDIVYKGSISYGATTKTASITYTSGFTANTDYDLFLEVYRLDEDDDDDGMGSLPVDTIDLGKVTTTTTSKKININNTLNSSFYVYRLCVGKNNFESTTTNDVYLCTNWLLPNDNTVRRFRSFSRCHFFQFLSLVEYDYDYDYDAEESTDNPNNPDNWGFFDTTEKYIYFNDGNCLGGFVSDSTNVFINVKRKDTSIDINDFYLILDKYSYPDGKKIDSYIIENSGDSSGAGLWSKVDDSKLIFDVSISDYFNFNASEDCYYFLRLHSYDLGYHDSTKAFYFNSSFFVDSSSQGGIIGTLLDGIKSLFIPSNEFFENYFNSLYLFLKSKLGFLWECVEFFPSLLTNIQSIISGVTQNTRFEIPELSVPTFDGTGSEVVILESFSWSPYEYFSENSVFIDFYTLYLDLIDFLVFWALFSFALDILANILGFLNGPEPEHKTIGF